MKTNRVIAFSLWGDLPMYTEGAIRNAELAPIIYPGWKTRYYIGGSVPDRTVDTLKSLGAEILPMKSDGDYTSMFWRFLAADDPSVDVMISRDCDSRLNSREKAAVDEWLKSPKLFHIMRDHPRHGVTILGGMWGAKKGAIKNLRKRIALWPKENRMQTDQEFLNKWVYPLVFDSAIVHDEFFEKKPFPTKRKHIEFVGEPFDEHDAHLDDHSANLAKPGSRGIPVSISLPFNKRISMRHNCQIAKLFYRTKRFYLLLGGR